MTKKSIKMCIAVVCVALLLLSPYIVELFTIKNGTFESVVVQDYPDVDFDNVTFTEYSLHLKPPAFTGDKFNEVFDYFKALHLKSEFPQKSQSKGGAFTIYFNGNDKSSGINYGLYETGFFIEFADNQLMTVRGKNGSHAYVVEGGIDMDYLYSFF